MSEQMYNEDQLDYMSYLATIPPEKKCWCGWYPLGECYHCRQSHPGKTCADKLKAEKNKRMHTYKNGTQWRVFRLRSSKP